MQIHIFDYERNLKTIRGTFCVLEVKNTQGDKELLYQKRNVFIFSQGSERV